MINWIDITHLGSFMVMTAAAAIIVAWLLFNRKWRLMVGWCMLYVGGMTLVVASKIAFIGWGIGYQPWSFTGFSGHAMRVAAVMPVLFYLVASSFKLNVQRVFTLLGWLFAAIIAFSRIVVHAHSVSEAITGYMVGAVGSALFIHWLARDQTASRFNSWIAASSLLVLLSSPDLPIVPTQSWIIEASLLLSGHDRPYIRETWRMSGPPRPVTGNWLGEEP